MTSQFGVVNSDGDAIMGNTGLVDGFSLLGRTIHDNKTRFRIFVRPFVCYLSFECHVFKSWNGMLVIASLNALGKKMNKN